MLSWNYKISEVCIVMIVNSSVALLKCPLLFEKVYYVDDSMYSIYK